MDVEAETHSQSPPNAPKPHDILWFPDGNVILATDTFLFKVYKAFLSLHSSVFRDMFKFPADGGPGAAHSGGAQLLQESYEGLPLVKLIGDKGEDVAHLLRAIFERHYYHRDNENTPLDVVTALLVLSTKYDFAELRRDVIFQISSHYSMLLQDCDAANEGSNSLFQQDRTDCHIPLLIAAFTADVDVLLPILYFSGTIATIEHVFIAAARGSMSPECLQTFIKGREALDTKIFRLVADLPEDLRGLADRFAPNGCSGIEPCVSMVQYHGLSNIAGTAFYISRGESIATENLPPVCASCKSLVVKSIEDKRQQIWLEIPSLFDCMGWDTAQEKLDELMESSS